MELENTPVPQTRVGIIGCGNISSAYLKIAPSFRNLEVRAVALGKLALPPVGVL